MADDIVIGYTEDGLVLLTYNDIVNKLTDVWKGLFGDDVDLSSDGSDGQLLRTFAEMIADEHDTVRSLDNSFNPDTSRGAAQDYRYRLNNIERKAGLYTSIPFTFTVINEEVTLAGLDGQQPDSAVAWGATDGTYNYYLNSTETFPVGTYTRQFTCSVTAAINPEIGSITEQIVDMNNINVTNITNGAATAIGATTESAEKFAARRDASTVSNGMNCCDSITRQLLQLPTVVNAKAYEHNYNDFPDEVDSDGIPLNFIWVVVNGGSANEIGRAIYENISGTGTKGSQSTTITSDSGQTLTFHFDYALTKNIYLKFKIKKLYSNFNLRIEDLKQSIADETQIDINASIDTSTLNAIIRQAIITNSEVVTIGGVPIDIEISANGTDWVQYLEGAGKQIKYILLPSNINIEVIE